MKWLDRNQDGSILSEVAEYCIALTLLAITATSVVDYVVERKPIDGERMIALATGVATLKLVESRKKPTQRLASDRSGNEKEKD